MLKNLLKEINMPEKATGLILELDKQIPYDKLAQSLEALHIPGNWEKGLAALQLQLGEDPRGLRMLTVMLHLADTYTRSQYRAKGIPEQIYIQTMACFSRFLGEYRDAEGEIGFDRQFWTPRQLSLCLFRIGTLEYELLENRGGKVISIHIPSDARLTKEALGQSYREAKLFLAAFYKEWEETPMECESWLLSPALPKLLEADSRILLFQKNFMITKTDPEAADYLEWVYHYTPGQAQKLLERCKDGIVTQEIISALPIRTTLQRNMKEYLQQGGKVGIACGILQSPWE